jgi:methylenetetrahydrofolate dehydrogenase (NADP+)/methenyltetrahydrofolate cyclohydrolase
VAGTGATGRHRVSAPQHQLRVPGRAILREVLAAYQEPFRQAILERGTRVLILRFTASTSDAWAARVPAAVISAEQKVRMFTALGARVDSLAIPDTTEPGELVDRLAAANEASDIAAIIVQTPPPPRLRDALDLIEPTKDIDALGADSPRLACATADGIVRIAHPFLTPDTDIAVVGALGFVGSGVVRLLREHGHTPLELDKGHDLRQLRDVDIVISTTGHAGLLTAEHLHTGHRLVVDAGFIPQPDGARGDVDPAAAHLPAAITPVPGGVGPVEMATLAERLTVQQAAPHLAPWRYLPPIRADHPVDIAEPATLTTAHRTVAELVELTPPPAAEPASTGRDRAAAPPPHPTREPDDVELERQTLTAPSPVLPPDAPPPSTAADPQGPTRTIDQIRDTLAEVRRALDAPRPHRGADRPDRALEPTGPDRADDQTQSPSRPADPAPPERGHDEGPELH